MPPVGFEPTVSAGERPKTYDLDRATTGTGIPDDVRVLIQFILLMMSTVMLETCRDEINKYMKKCVKLVIRKNL